MSNLFRTAGKVSNLTVICSAELSNNKILQGSGY